MKEGLRFVGGFSALIAAVYLPVLLIAPGGYLKSLSYHSDRGIEIESLYATYALLRKFFGESVSIYTRYGSKNIYWSGEYLAMRYWMVFSLLAMGLGYLHAFFKMKPSNRDQTLQPQRAPLINVLAESCLILVLAFITFSKVLSVQYILWLFPLFLWVRARRKMVIPMALQIALGTQLIYPFFFTSLVYLKNDAISILLWRNVLLVLLFLCLIDWKVIFEGLKSAPGWFSQRQEQRTSTL